MVRREHAEEVRDATEADGNVTVTVEVIGTEYPEKGPHKRGLLKDESGVIELIAWDEDEANALDVEQGDYVAIRDADVTDYDGVSHLTVATAGDAIATEVVPIQPDAGYGPEPNTLEERRGGR